MYFKCLYIYIKQIIGLIVIWNMGPIVDNEKENDKSSPRILCKMEHHIC